MASTRSSPRALIGLGYLPDDMLKDCSRQIQWQLGENFRGKKKNGERVVCSNMTVDIEPLSGVGVAGAGDWGRQTSTYPKEKVYTQDSEKVFMNNATRHVILAQADKGKNADTPLHVAVLDTERYDSSRAVPGHKKVVIMEHDPGRFQKMLANRPWYVKLVKNADTYYLSWFNSEPLDVDILDFCYTWRGASIIVHERFATGMYKAGTIVRLTVASRTSTPGPRLTTWKNEIVSDIVAWASNVGLGVVFFCVCDWGPEVGKWKIADTNSIVYEYGNTGSPMYNFIFKLVGRD